MASRSTDRNTNENWFEAGASALDRVTQVSRGMYGCPVCFGLFGREDLGQLTLEHVPPRALGGRKLVLTCKECNSIAGHTMDSHAAKREAMLDFVEGTMRKPLRARLTWAGAEVNVDVHAAGNGLLMTGAASDPEQQSLLSSELERLSQTRTDDYGFNISLTGGAHRHREALVSLLRSAYLAAFAAFGYRYVLQPAVRETVRQQILRPSEELLRVFSMTLMKDSRPSASTMLLVEEPQELQSIVVSFGRHAVFLPRPPLNPGLFDYLALQDVSTVQRPQFHGSLLAWPRRPTYLLDV